jgi:hypothetical protein
MRSMWNSTAMHITKETRARMQQQDIHGVAAAFDAPDKMLAAAKEIRKAGYANVEAYTPFPVHGIDDVLGIPHSKLGYIVLCFGITGACLALLLQWWTGAGDVHLLPAWTALVPYPLVIGGKPLFAFEPSIPITFELTVLLSAFAAVFGMLGLNGLPRLYHPVFNFANAKKITDDQFVLVIEKADPKFDADEAQKLMQSLNAVAVEVVPE